MINGQQLTASQELQVRRAAARHLTGIPARHNASSIELLETQLAYEEIVARFGADEISRCERMEQSLGLIQR